MKDCCGESSHQKEEDAKSSKSMQTDKSNMQRYIIIALIGVLFILFLVWAVVAKESTDQSPGTDSGESVQGTCSANLLDKNPGDEEAGSAPEGTCQGGI